MPSGTCAPSSRSQTYNTTELAGGVRGSVIITVRYGWDNVSVRPTCNGPVQDVRVRNTGTATHWVLLPAKRSGSTWLEVLPGADTTTSGAGLTALGLTSYSDIAGVTVTNVQPA